MQTLVSSNFFRYILNLDYNIYEYDFVVVLNWKKNISSVILHFEIFKFDLKLILHNKKQRQTRLNEEKV